MKIMSKKEKCAFVALTQDMIGYITNQFSPDVVLFISCQFALESNFGTSNLAISCFNISGMRHPLVRLTSSRCPNPNGFATYDDFYHCVFDYILCLNYHQIGGKECESVKCFSHFISKWYCPSKDYIKRIMSIYDEFKQFSNYSLKLNLNVFNNEK